MAAIKLLLGAATGALALLADGIHALLDASSNIVGLVGIAAAARPADAGHPYGHRRFETLAAVLIGLLIMSGMYGILRGLMDALRGTRAPPEVAWSAAALLLVTILSNMAISRYESRRGRELQSALLHADAGHTLSDTFGAIAVLISFGAMALGFHWADLIAAVVVAVLIGRTALGVLGKNLGVLADSARLDPHAVRRVAMEIADVRGAHKSARAGRRNHVLVDLHIHVDPGMRVDHAHAVTHQVAEAVRAAFPEVADVLIHTEPADGRESDVSTVALPTATGDLTDDSS